MAKTDANIYDAVIIGGGPVGLIVALALADLGRVALVERTPIKEAKGNGFDGRVLALTHASVEFLATVGLKESLEPYLTAIKGVHVSQKGYLGLTRMTAEEMRVPALGYSIQGRDLGQVLWEAVTQSASIEVCCPNELQAVQPGEHEVVCELKDGMSLKTRLLIGADGTESKVRRLYDLPIERKTYDAMAVITQLYFDQPHQGWAYERFTSTGPMALLPMEGDQGHSAKAVWVMPPEQWARMQKASDAVYLTAFAERMGERFGRYTATSQRLAYPLAETLCPALTAQRMVLMGNAAHTQHPVAAQGLNLGIDDVQAWRDIVQTLSSSDWGQGEALALYASGRKQRYQRIMGLTDSLIDWFQRPSSVLGHARGLGLMAMEAVGPLRRRLASLAMGRRI
ncbi:FAD-dependent monooxygenase [Thiomicrospira sp. WB1]|uniref:FAD-dependent monooxygenase n=1 Tax=Thiomicrospira sp. WB1 TaxID=1685380 RepID=UPI0007463E12|nr:FAD-dependent monooxygenase [Thiomicrospira sp. WB1]KUJ72981.1 hypothetical protein AVO41_04245 [Thiomicrospira sp. WB1]